MEPEKTERILSRTTVFVIIEVVLFFLLTAVTVVGHELFPERSLDSEIYFALGIIGFTIAQISTILINTGQILRVVVIVWSNLIITVLEEFERIRQKRISIKSNIQKIPEPPALPYSEIIVEPKQQEEEQSVLVRKNRSEE